MSTGCAGDLLDRPSANLSERAYQAMLPDGAASARLAASAAGSISSCGRTIAFDIYPDQVDFMQFLPVSPTETLIREISYALPDERREMKAARYLNWRINRRVNAEDTALIARRPGRHGLGELSRPGRSARARSACAASRASCGGSIPEARLDRPPLPGWSGRPLGAATGMT